MMSPYISNAGIHGMPFIQFAWPLLLLLVAWDLYWRGRALWQAAQHKESYWFIALLLVNSVGILPLLYLFVFSKGKKSF